MVTRPSTSLTLVFLFAVAAVVMSSDYGSDGAVESASGSLPADILAANADYERRGREIETGITDASWLASQNGLEARREAIVRWQDENAALLEEQAAHARQIDQLYEQHGMTRGLLPSDEYAALRPPTPETASTIEGWQRLLAISLHNLRREFHGQPPEALREAMREWQEDNAENLAALAARREEQAAARPTSLSTVEAPLTLPADSSAEVRRLAELRSEHVRRMRALPAHTAGGLSLEAAVARREALRAALGPLEEETEAP